MSLYIEEEGSVTLPFDTEEIAIAVTEAALDYAECPYEAEINLLLTENQEIHEMNLEQRGIDRPTDVLSFPMIEYDAPGEFSVIDEETGDAFNPETGELMLGDMSFQSEKYSLRQKSMDILRKENMHFDCPQHAPFIGYDHMEEEERAEMEAHQRAIMGKSRDSTLSRQVQNSRMGLPWKKSKNFRI